MKPISRILALLTACTLMGTGCWYVANDGSSDSTSPVDESRGEAEVAFIDADRFAIPELDANSAAHLSSEDAFACRAFRGGIVNHHALASDLLAGFFRVLKRCRPDLKTFIILSPDHNLAATASVVTHSLAYRTEGREIAANTEGVHRLLAEAPFAKAQSELFEREHGIGALLPFLANEFPDVQLVPAVVRFPSTEGERRIFSQWISHELQDPTTFLIVSSDMSHYLDESTARANDRQTKQALEDGNREFFSHAKDAFTDNGPSIDIAMQALGDKKWTLLAESISSAYAGSPAFTTTYLIGFWE